MPYQKGYSVLPNLTKLGDEPIFQRDTQYDRYIEEKHKAVQHQPCFLEHEMSADIYEPIVEFIVSRTDWVSASTFESVAMQLQEDVAILRIRDSRDWLAACHICFPSDWRPEEKIGRPLREIHAPIPGMNLETSHKLATTMVHHGPFVRWVWSPVYEPTRINYHPRTSKSHFDPANPCLHLKLERQVTHGFPDLGAALFIMRQQILPPEQIDFPALYKALSEMTPEEKIYKGVTNELLDWMRKQEETATGAD